MKVTMLLADAAQETGGKLFVLGGGWSVTGPMPVPSAVGIIFSVPWDRSDEKHEFVLELLDFDGNPFIGEDGNPLRTQGSFETGRPAGLKRGTPLDSALAVSIPPLNLAPDSRYVWQLTLDGESRDEWRLPFSTRPAQAAPGAPPGFQAQ